MHHEDIGKYVLEMNCLLGSGTYSKVYRGFVKKSKEPVAIKKINIEQLRKNRETVETIIQEAEMLKSL
jgi:serine/threonine protein kinase